MESVFVTGTDTGVGKTTVCAGLLKLMLGTRKVCYWKPVQTGTVLGDDTKDVKELVGSNEVSFLEPTYRFPDPLSPHMAAKRWGKTVELDVLTSVFTKAKAAGHFLIVEGAGGILVPLNENVLLIDLIKKLGTPVLLVGEDRVGTINQALLTIRTCRENGLNVLGVVLTRARRTLGNADAISHFGKVDILAEIDPMDDRRSVVAQVAGHDGLRKVFNVQPIPK